MRQFTLGLGLVALASFGACSDSGNTATGPGKQVKLAVAPLKLESIGNACYDIEVRNSTAGGGDLVWSQGNHANGSAATAIDAALEGAICAETYGNGPGGDIAYVGPCDASDDGILPATTRTNSVSLWVENIYYANLEAVPNTEWDNPYPPIDAAPSHAHASNYDFECAENQDTSVVFNIVILRDANQGFFDVAVNFANVFCSGKVDTCDKDGKDINLLFDRGDSSGGAGAGKRVKSAVVAFACSGGTNFNGNQNTTLYADDIHLDCDAGPVDQNLNLTRAEGNQIFPADNTTGFIQWALYRGEESLNCGNDTDPNDCNKMYWNTAIAFDPTLAHNCTISGNFSVGSLEDPALQFGFAPYTTPAFTRYPVLGFKVKLTGPSGWMDDDGNASNGLCVNVPLGNNDTVDHTFQAYYTETSGTCFDGRYKPNGSGGAGGSDPDGVATWFGCP